MGGVGLPQRGGVGEAGRCTEGWDQPGGGRGGWQSGRSRPAAGAEGGVGKLLEGPEVTARPFVTLVGQLVAVDGLVVWSQPRGRGQSYPGCPAR